MIRIVEVMGEDYFWWIICRCGWRSSEVQKGIHYVVMKNIRYQNKRDSRIGYLQNWINIIWFKSVSSVVLVVYENVVFLNFSDGSLKYQRG